MERCTNLSQGRYTKRLPNNAVNRRNRNEKEYGDSEIFNYARWRHNKWNQYHNSPFLCKSDYMAQKLKDPKDVIPEIHTFKVYDKDLIHYHNYYVPDLDVPIEEIVLSFTQYVSELG